MSLVKYLEEEGPVAVEAHILKKMIYNLKKVDEQDGIVEKKVEKVIELDKRKSIRLLEKSVCRMFCYKDN